MDYPLHYVRIIRIVTTVERNDEASHMIFDAIDNFLLASAQKVVPAATHMSPGIVILSKTDSLFYDDEVVSLNRGNSMYGEASVNDETAIVALITKFMK